MKQTICFILVIIILSSFGCSPKTGNENVLEVPITDNMNLESTKTEEVEGKNMSLSTYTVENGNLDTFLSEYQKILNDAGWTTVALNEPGFLKVQKDNNEVIVMPYEENNKLKVDIVKNDKTKE